MDTFTAMTISNAAAARGDKQKIFDWNKAAQLIKDRKVSFASVGLQSDWEWTRDTIFEDGKPKLDASPYLSSNWATPELDLDGEIVSCYLLEDNNPNNWNQHTIWPQSALDILNG